MQAANPVRDERNASCCGEPSGPGLQDFSSWKLRLLGVRMSPSDPRVQTLRAALMEGDPPADALIQWMAKSPNGRALFEQALERGVGSIEGDVPTPLARFFEDVERVPAWVNRRELRVGTEAMLRFGRGGLYALGPALMNGYLSVGGTKPLAFTGALTKMARRRIQETGKFVFDIATSGELLRFSDGFKSTVRVRMFHAQVRAGLQRSPAWRTEAWGVPINQRYMVGTLLEFTVVFLSGLFSMGYLVSSEERGAIMHMWRYLGLVLGTREDLLPTSFKEGIELAWIFNATEKGPDDDGRTLARALVEVWREGASNIGLSGRIEGRFLNGLTRFCLGRRASDALDLPDDVWQWAPLVVAPVRAGLECLRVIAPGGRKIAVRVGRAQMRREVAQGLGQATPAYASTHPLASS